MIESNSQQITYFSVEFDLEISPQKVFLPETKQTSQSNPCFVTYKNGVKTKACFEIFKV